MRVRQFSLEDYEQVNALGRWFQENSFYAGCGWSDQKTLTILAASTHPDSNHFARVVSKDDQIIGFFLGSVTEYFFSEKKIAQDLVMVFKPEERKGILKPTVQMLDEFYDWAKEKNAHEVCIGITSGIAGDGYEKLCIRRGFKKSGSILKRGI